MVYSKRGCGFCTKAKNLLNEYKVEYKVGRKGGGERERRKECQVSELDEVQRMKPDEYQTYVNGLVYTSRMTSVPQVGPSFSLPLYQFHLRSSSVASSLEDSLNWKD